MRFNRKLAYSAIGIFVLLIIIGVSSDTNTPIPSNGDQTAQQQETVNVLPPITTETPTIDGGRDSNLVTDNSKPLYLVTKVIDGDTFSVQINGKVETVRLIGLDTPETVHPSKPVECFGNEASNKARSILEGKQVSLESDVSQGERDKYSRLLSYVFLPDGTNFNKLMIAEGYGHEYTYNLPYKYQAEFKQAERIAREQKRGLWVDDVCETKQQAPVQPAPAVIPPSQGSSSYTCLSNAYNCDDFATHAEAQGVFNMCGGVGNDIHRLDSDGDGIACESLP